MKFRIISSILILVVIIVSAILFGSRSNNSQPTETVIEYTQ